MTISFILLILKRVVVIIKKMVWMHLKKLKLKLKRLENLNEWDDEFDTSKIEEMKRKREEGLPYISEDVVELTQRMQGVVVNLFTEESKTECLRTCGTTFKSYFPEFVN